MYKKKILFFQILIVILIIIIWELLAKFNIINTFIMSSPSRMLKTLIYMFSKGNLLKHILVTLKEIIIAFILGASISFIISILLYSNKFIADILDPFFTMINSLPKVALGPIIIIWMGANNKSIIFMALLINVIVSIITIYNGFVNTDTLKLKLFKSFNASKFDTIFKLVIPENTSIILSAFKVNISMTLIGVIMGEFLVSKSGIGYVILYGTQVFNLDMVNSAILILVLLSYILYLLLNRISEKITY